MALCNQVSPSNRQWTHFANNPCCWPTFGADCRASRAPYVGLLHVIPGQNQGRSFQDCGILGGRQGNRDPGRMQATEPQTKATSLIESTVFQTGFKTLGVGTAPGRRRRHRAGAVSTRSRHLDPDEAPDPGYAHALLSGVEGSCSWQPVPLYCDGIAYSLTRVPPLYVSLI